jgi:hypothetical protein
MITRVLLIIVAPGRPFGWIITVPPDAHVEQLKRFSGYAGRLPKEEGFLLGLSFVIC